jgi:hypothetical protein
LFEISIVFWILEGCGRVHINTAVLALFARRSPSSQMIVKK